MKKTTFGVIITHRSFFPSHLVSEVREKLLKKLDALGYGYVMPSAEETEFGAVRTYADSKKCAEIFRAHRSAIDGILVILPNFGEELGVADAIDLAGLNVPVMVQACSDSVDRLQIANRRDAFCGKISVCSNLYQRGIKFTDTTSHVCDIDSEEFTQDIQHFAGVCNVVRGLSHARLGAIGARPNAFNTVRYSEKLLQAAGISVSCVDLSDIIAEASAMPVTGEVGKKVAEIKAYGHVSPEFGEDKVVRQAKLCLTLQKWVDDNECDASAIQCWDSIQNHYGCATCLAMSMMGEQGKPSACEMDVTGALTMLAMQFASGTPSGYMDWNNNYKDEKDMCINLHCSNFPKTFFGTEFEISALDVLGTTIGQEKCFGACKAQIAAGPMTYAKITTDDRNGKIKAYVGEGEFLADPVDTKGGVALCRIPGLREMLRHITQNGFEHHVALSRGLTADILEEALGKYLGWEVYRHH